MAISDGIGNDAAGTRTKVVTWEDPLASAAKGLALSGRDYLLAVQAGEIPPPPIARLMGFDLVQVGEGEARFSVTPDESLYNPIGMVHGGLMATLLDSVLGCAVHSTLPAGAAYASIEIKVNYLRTVTATSGELTAHGWVTKAGRRVAFAEGDARDAAGNVMATASSSLLVSLPQ